MSEQNTAAERGDTKLENANTGGGDDGSDTESIEREAKLYGWVPPEEFKGAESDYIGPEDFVRRGKEINPLLRKNNEKLLRELNKRDAQIAELDLTMKEFGEMYKKMSENAYTRAMEEVKGQIREARKIDDHEQVDSLSEQLETLKEQSKTISVPGGDRIGKIAGANARNVILEQWIEENPWYDEASNPDLYYAAEGIAMKLANTPEGRAMAGKREFLDAVQMRVQKAMPDRFKNQRRANGSPVSGGSSTRSGFSSGSGRKSYNDLPAEARAACDRQVKSIPGFTKEKYVNYYFEQEGA